MDEDAAAKCRRCGRVLDDGEARILVGFTIEELANIAIDTRDESTRGRALCAIGLLDHRLETELRAAMIADEAITEELDPDA